MITTVKKSLPASPTLLLWIITLASAVFMLFNRDAAYTGAVSGLNLCVNVILTTVFPFSVVASLFVNSGLCGAVGRLLGGVPRRVFGLSCEGVGVLLLGLVGGYPYGAFSASRLYGDNFIGKNEAERLISFCNNATPAFMTVYLGGLLGDYRKGLLCYGCVILSAFIFGIIIRKETVNVSRAEFSHSGTLDIFVSSIKESSVTAVYICGFIIMFSVFSSCAVSLWSSSEVSAIIISLLEITGGLSSLISVVLNDRLLCGVCCAVTSLSGLCVLSQVGAEVSKYGLSLKLYFIGKPVQAVISFLLCYFTYPFIFGV